MFVHEAVRVNLGHWQPLIYNEVTSAELYLEL